MSLCVCLPTTRSSKLFGFVKISGCIQCSLRLFCVMCVPQRIHRWGYINLSAFMHIPLVNTVHWLACVFNHKLWPCATLSKPVVYTRCARIHYYVWTDAFEQSFIFSLENIFLFLSLLYRQSSQITLGYTNAAMDVILFRTMWGSSSPISSNQYASINFDFES